MRTEYGELFEGILDNIDKTDSGTSAQKLASDNSKDYQYSILFTRSSQILSVFKLDSRLPEEENKEIIREECSYLYNNMFDLLHSLLDSSPLIKDNYIISFVELNNNWFQRDVRIEDKIANEWTEDEWIEAAPDFWTQYSVMASPMVAVRIRCNLNQVSFKTFNRQFASFYQKTVNREKMLSNSAIYVTDDTSDTIKMKLMEEKTLPEQLASGYCKIFDVDIESIEDSDIEKLSKRIVKKSYDIQRGIRYLIWLEKETASNPQENIKFKMDGLFHKYSQFGTDKSYQFVFKAEPKDGTYSLPELKHFITKKFLAGLERYGFHPWRDHDIEVYILEGGAYMTDDMKKNPMEIGSVEINGQTSVLRIGFLDFNGELYPCGRRKKFLKLQNFGIMFGEWVQCKTGHKYFF